MTLSNLLTNLRELQISKSGIKTANQLTPISAIASFAEFELELLEFSENYISFEDSGIALKSILQKVYTAGTISGFDKVQIKNGAITGTFYENLTPTLSKRFSFTASPTGIFYELINADQLENANYSESEISELDFAAIKTKACKTGKPCHRPDGTIYCISKGFKCPSERETKAEKVKRTFKPSPTEAIALAKIIDNQIAKPDAKIIKARVSPAKLAELSKKVDTHLNENDSASVADLQKKLGYPASKYGNEPETNPVNKILAGLRDSKKITVGDDGKVSIDKNKTVVDSGDIAKSKGTESMKTTATETKPTEEVRSQSATQKPDISDSLKKHTREELTSMGGMSPEYLKLVNPIKDRVLPLVEANPAYKELKATVDRTIASTYDGKNGVETQAHLKKYMQSPENYLTNLPLSAKTGSGKKIEELQGQIRRDLDLPKEGVGTYRSNNIDWNKMIMDEQAKLSTPKSESTSKSPAQMTKDVDSKPATKPLDDVAKQKAAQRLLATPQVDKIGELPTYDNYSITRTSQDQKDYISHLAKVASTLKPYKGEIVVQSKVIFGRKIQSAVESATIYGDTGFAYVPKNPDKPKEGGSFTHIASGMTAGSLDSEKQARQLAAFISDQGFAFNSPDLATNRKSLDSLAKLLKGTGMLDVHTKYNPIQIPDSWNSTKK